jgi:hypothetical protein
MHRTQRLTQQRVGEQVDLADREIVGRSAPEVELTQFVGRSAARSGEAVVMA